jgi:hypothetical protein
MKDFILSFNPNRHKFDAKWCLDLYGFLSRDDLRNRINEINHRIKDYPLMSARTVKLLSFLVVILSIGITIGVSKIAPGAASGATALLFIIILVAGLIYINKLAKERAEAFTRALENLFNEYNTRDNPTANWGVVWFTVITSYKVEMHSTWLNSAEGSIKPKYANCVMIVLEISDALSDRTSEYVHVNLPLDHKV